MDSSVNTGDGLNSSLVFLSSDGYYASQAIHSGLFGGAAMHNLTLPKSGREAIGREILKERIREEILAREMVERRILEEEVRREIEMERIMELRRLQMERWPDFPGTSGMLMHGDRQTLTYMPSWIEPGIAASLGRGVVQDGAEFAFRERSLPHLVPKKTTAVMTKPSLRHESEKLPPSKETTTSSCKVSGAKRKAQDEPLIPAEKLWGCALCEITASSEEVLRDHLQGKKHKAMESLLNSKKKPCPPLQSKQKNEAAPLEGASGGGGGGGGPMSMKKKPAEGKKQQKFWCGLCRVKCNSVIMMEYHIAGKKHRNLVELKKANDGLKADEAANKSEANEKPVLGEAQNEKPVLGEAQNEKHGDAERAVPGDAERAGFMKEEC